MIYANRVTVYRGHALVFDYNIHSETIKKLNWIILLLSLFHFSIVWEGLSLFCLIISPCFLPLCSTLSLFTWISHLLFSSMLVSICLKNYLWCPDIKKLCILRHISHLDIMWLLVIVTRSWRHRYCKNQLHIRHTVIEYLFSRYILMFPLQM